MSVQTKICILRVAAAVHFESRKEPEEERLWRDHRVLEIVEGWESVHENQHRDGRLVDLRIVPAENDSNGDQEPQDGDVVTQTELLQHLCCFSFRAGAPYIDFFRTDKTHIGFHLDYLFKLHERANIAAARRDLKVGWLELFRDSMRPQIGFPHGLVDGPDVALRPIPMFLPSGSTWGEVLLTTAAARGLYPKAYFQTQDDRKQRKPTIRLIPSPIADLSTAAEPVTAESLEISLISYSENEDSNSEEDKFHPSPEGRTELIDVIRQLVTVDSNGLPNRYYGIDIRVHEAIKTQVVSPSVKLDPWVSLTRILDALSYDVHGRWFWSGASRIDLVPRNYSEFIPF